MTLDTLSRSNPRRPIDVCGVGEIDIDLYMQVDELPLSTEKNRSDHVELHPGGMIGNFVVNATRAGLRASYQGRYGGDRFGAEALAALRQEGVDVSRATHRPDSPGFFCVVLHDGRGMKQLVTAVTECKDFDKQDIDLHGLREARHVHTNLTPETPWLVAQARSAGCTVSVDLDLLPKSGPPAWARDVNVLFVAEREQRTARANVAQDLLVDGCDLVVSTRGADGATAYQKVDGDLMATEVDTPPVRVSDTTGAGDCFAAWSVAALLQGEPLDAALRLGSAAASLSTEGRGSRSAIPTREAAQRSADGLATRTWMPKAIPDKDDQP